MEKRDENQEESVGLKKAFSTFKEIQSMSKRLKHLELQLDSEIEHLTNSEFSAYLSMKDAFFERRKMANDSGEADTD